MKLETGNWKLETSNQQRATRIVMTKKRILIIEDEANMRHMLEVLLRGAGYEVNDLGSDVSPEQIVASVREEKPDILGLSALLTTTMVAMRETIDSLTQAGLRDKVKVIIGGAPTSAEFANEIGADGYGADAFHAQRIAEELMQASRG